MLCEHCRQPSDIFLGPSGSTQRMHYTMVVREVSSGVSVDPEPCTLVRGSVQGTVATKQGTVATKEAGSSPRLLQGARPGLEAGHVASASS